MSDIPVTNESLAPSSGQNTYARGSYQVRAQRTRFFIHLILFAYAIILILPTIVVISSSFSDEQDIGLNGYPLFPRKWSLAAYQFLFNDASPILQSYGVTITVTALGTLSIVLVNSMFAYALMRKTFRLRRPLGLSVIFTTLFNGGMVASFLIMTQVLHLDDTIWVLFVPGIMSVWNVFLLRTYFSSLPQELIDAAKIDGASEWRIFGQIVLPLSTPILATVALFAALGIWNNWFTALLYISNPDLYPLQYLLYQIQGSFDYLRSTSQYATSGVDIQLPQETVRMAMVVITTGPIVLLFLPLQKYFVRGIVLGGLKGD